MKPRNRKKSGFANTKEYPHRKHPARYRRTGSDDIEYLTTTHHEEVLLNGKTIKTIPLDNNINPKERGTTKKTFVYPKVYIGKRSHLGKERGDLQLVGKDIEKVSKLFDTLPKETVKHQSNSKNKK